MTQKPKYFIIEASLLPEVFLKTAEANRLLKNGEADTVGEAAQKVGLSRSAPVLPGGGKPRHHVLYSAER